MRKKGGCRETGGWDRCGGGKCRKGVREVRVWEGEDEDGSGREVL